MFNNFKNSIQMLNKAEPKYIPYAVLNGFLLSILPFINLIASSYLLDELVHQRRIQQCVIIISGMLLLNFIISSLQKRLDRTLEIYKAAVSTQVEIQVAKKSMNISYGLLEDPDTLYKVQQAREGQNGSGGLSSFATLLQSSFQNIFIMIESIFLLFPIFFTKGNPTTELEHFFDSPSACLVLGFIVLLVFVLHVSMLRKQNALEMQFFADNVYLNRVYDYYMDMCYLDYAAGKDMRLYHMQNMMYEKLADTNKKSMKLYLKYMTIRGKRSGVQAAGNELINGVMYIFIAAKVLIGAITLGSFLRYAGAITQLTIAIAALIRLVIFLQLQAQYFTLYAQFLKLQEEDDKKQDLTSSAFELEFHDVSFTYPNRKEQALRHVSMRIQKGEQLAVVGKNGAGKTTFIKLICRLYEPDEGYITLNGIDIKEYPFASYMNALSVVFQDFHLLSFTLGENIAVSKMYDKRKVWEVLEAVGMSERVERMENQLDTILYQDGEQGIEISGGEAQKFAIARALYKDAPFVILDEPTAALDPISEYEIYKRFYELCEDKTSIFISHRMSSCRFAKRIIVFDHGEIVEEGTHETLVDKHGLYAAMWKAQAQHYQEENNDFEGLSLSKS